LVNSDCAWPDKTKNAMKKLELLLHFYKLKTQNNNNNNNNYQANNQIISIKNNLICELEFMSRFITRYDMRKTSYNYKWEFRNNIKNNKNLVNNAKEIDKILKKISNLYDYMKTVTCNIDYELIHNIHKIPLNFCESWIKSLQLTSIHS